MTIDDLLEVVKNYNPEEVDIIRKAYEYAFELHRGQYQLNTILNTTLLYKLIKKGVSNTCEKIT